MECLHQFAEASLIGILLAVELGSPYPAGAFACVARYHTHTIQSLIFVQTQLLYNTV